MNCYTKNTSLGNITIIEDNGFITNLFLSCDSSTSKNNKRTETIDQAFKELDEYLSGKRRVFNIPLNPNGTEFQRRVWQELLQIPYGKTSTYKDIAEKIGKRGACRAVGNANNKNPIPIFIPCHRVIRADNLLSGYSLGAENKEKLLKIEGVIL